MKDASTQTFALQGQFSKMIQAEKLLTCFSPTNKLVARMKLGLPLDKKLVAFGDVNLSNRRKGSDTLQAAVGHLKKMGQSADVEGVYFGSDRLDLGIPIHNMPHILDEAHLSLIYAAADVFACPSRDVKSQLTVAEALLSGTPVVAFPVGNGQQQILHKDTGFIARTDDAKEFAEGLAWALIGTDRDMIRLRCLRCHLHARTMISELLADTVLLGQPAKQNDDAAIRGAVQNEAFPSISQFALIRNSVTKTSFASWRISEAVFDEHEIKGTVVGEASGDDVFSDPMLPNVIAFNGDEAVAIAPLRSKGDVLAFHLELPRTLLFDIPESSIELRIGVPSLSPEATNVVLPQRPLISAERLLQFDRPDAVPSSRRNKLGIVLYSFTRTAGAMLVLESLKRQGALEHVEIWMDGDQGKSNVKKKLEAAEAQFRDFGVDRVTRHRGNLGFRKLILQSLMYMTDTYDRFIVLEDDCFPNRNAVEEFKRALDRHADNPEVLTTYGHHFLVPAEQPLCPRFQGWGWATWSDKIKPFLPELAYLYSLREEEYTAWTKAQMTPEILARLDCTDPRGASITLQRFFAWDETLALLAALADMKHAPTENRCVYNFGAGEDSTHFTNIDLYRKPPFNMISKNEVWDHF